MRTLSKKRTNKRYSRRPPKPAKRAPIQELADRVCAEFDPTDGCPECGSYKFVTDYAKSPPTSSCVSCLWTSDKSSDDRSLW